MYFWITGEDENGKPFLYGPKMTEQEAYAFGCGLNPPVAFTVEAMDTYDQAEASRRLKGNVLEKTGNVSLALRRLRHKVK